MAFLCMGFADAVGPLVNIATEVFDISNAMASLIASAGFIMYGVVSIPMGIMQHKIGKKPVMIIGIVTFFIGVVIPAMGLNFLMILLSVMIMGAGSTIMQVSGTPILRDVSQVGKFSRNLSFGQFIKAVASLSTSLIPAMVAGKLMGDYFTVKSASGILKPTEWRIMFPVYALIVFITVITIVLMKYKENSESLQAQTTLKSCFGALSNKYILMMVLGIFAYCGAEISITSKVAVFFSKQYNIDLAKLGMLGIGMFFLALTIGRFLGSVILNWMKPVTFLVATSIVSLLGLLLIFINSLTLAWIAVFFIGIGFGNIFPLILSITIDRIPEKTNEISGLMLSAVIGGSIIPLIAGLVADINLKISFIVPLLCICYVLIIALKDYRTLKNV